MQYGTAFYDEDTETDQQERQIKAEKKKKKALRLLQDEVPHGIAVSIEKMRIRPDGIMNIDATIICERDSHKGIIIGKSGSMLKRIGTQSRIDIEKMVEHKVNLQIWVKVRKNWRDDKKKKKNLGYDMKNE